MYGRESPGLEFRIPGFKPGIALPLFGLNLFILIFDIRERAYIWLRSSQGANWKRKTRKCSLKAYVKTCSSDIGSYPQKTQLYPFYASNLKLAYINSYLYLHMQREKMYMKIYIYRPKCGIVISKVSDKEDHFFFFCTFQQCLVLFYFIMSTSYLKENWKKKRRLKTGWGKIPFKCKTLTTMIKTNTIIPGFHFRAKENTVWLSAFPQLLQWIPSSQALSTATEEFAATVFDSLMSSTRKQPCYPLIYPSLHCSSALRLFSTRTYAQALPPQVLLLFYRSLLQGHFGSNTLELDPKQHPKTGWV